MNLDKKAPVRLDGAKPGRIGTRFVAAGAVGAAKQEEQCAWVFDTKYNVGSVLTKTTRQVGIGGMGLAMQ